MTQDAVDDQVARESIPVAFIDRADATPIACTLPTDALPGRLDDWEGVLRHVSRRERGADGSLRLAFDPSVPIRQIADLVAAEQSCCNFFAFAITVDQRGIGLEVRAPDNAEPVVQHLFGAPDSTD